MAEIASKSSNPPITVDPAVEFRKNGVYPSAISLLIYASNSYGTIDPVILSHGIVLQFFIPIPATIAPLAME